jgi:methionyl-tRNA formyltransferase
MSLRVIFMGTPEFAVPTLVEIIGQGHEVVAVYTREPAQAGRGMELRHSAVHKAALQLGLPVFTPKSLRTEDAAALFASHMADVAVVVAYGKLLPRAILDAPHEGCFNLHGSLLPRWRGAAPIQRAVMAGDAMSGVCVMKMEEGLDTGPVAMVERCSIGPDTTAGELHDRLMALGADLMARALAALSRGSLGFVTQPEEGVTYAAKISNAEAQLDFAQAAGVLYNKVRGLSPFPGAFLILDLGKGLERVKVLRARHDPAHDNQALAASGTILDSDGLIACGSGALRLVDVQRAGRATMPAAEFLRGARLAVGNVLPVIQPVTLPVPAST